MMIAQAPESRQSPATELSNTGTALVEATPSTSVVVFSEECSLIAQINESHRLALASAGSAVQHAIRCGELLLEQRQRMAHGEFRAWVSTNCVFAQSTASRYLVAAKRNATGVAISSLSRLFPSGEKKRQTKKAPESADTPPDARDGNHASETEQSAESKPAKRSEPTSKTEAAAAFKRRALDLIVELAGWRHSDVAHLTQSDAAELARRIVEVLPSVAQFCDRLAARAGNDRFSLRWRDNSDRTAEALFRAVTPRIVSRRKPRRRAGR